MSQTNPSIPLSMTTIKKFQVTGGERHLAHVLRLQTKRELSGDIEVIRGSSETILGQPDPTRSSCKNWYLEVMTHAPDDTGALKVADHLEERIKRPSLVVRHDDESKRHYHLLFPWVGEDHKALRLQVSAFRRIMAEIADILGQKLTPRGQGRPLLSIKEYQANPVAAQLKIRKITEEDRASLATVERVLSIYGAIDLYARSGQLPMAGIEDRESRYLQTVTHIDELNLRRLRALERYENRILFAPTAPIRVLYLKEPSSTFIPHLPPETLLVGHGRGRVDCHIPLLEPMDEERSAMSQMMLALAHLGDHTATGALELRWLPGFRTPDRVPMRFVEREDPPQGVSIEDLLKDLADVREEGMRAQRALRKSPDYLRAAHKVPFAWEDFLHSAASDYELTDRLFARSLISHGLSARETELFLKAESFDLALRFLTGWSGEYVKQVVTGAWSLIHGTWQAPEPSAPRPVRIVKKDPPPQE